MSNSVASPRIFVSYVREDAARVVRLAHALDRAGMDVWYDKAALQPGQFWQREIREAIARGDYFLACFSDYHAARAVSYMNEELTLAIEQLRRRPHDRTWFIPVLLDPGEVPDRDIGAGQTLRDIQAANLSGDWDEGVAALLRVLRSAPPSARMPRDAEPAMQRRLSGMSLSEELFLLCCGPETGALPEPAQKYGFGAAALAELIFANRIRYDRIGKLSLVDRSPVPDAVLNRRFDYYVRAASGNVLSPWDACSGNDPQAEIVEHLITENILERFSERRWFIGRKVTYRVKDMDRWNDLRSQFASAVAEEETMTNRIAALAAIATWTCGTPMGLSDSLWQRALVVASKTDIGRALVDIMSAARAVDVQSYKEAYIHMPSR